MNIVLFAAVDFPETDAPGQRASLIVKGLRAAGEDAFMLIPHASRTGNVAENERTSGHFNAVPFLYLNGHTSRPLGRMAAISDTLKGMIAGSFVLIRRKRKGSVDAVLLYSPDTLKYFIVIFTCIILRIPFFVEICEMMTTMREGRNWKSKISMLGYFLTERVLPYLARGYIVISSSLFEHYLKYLTPPGVHLLPILIDDMKPDPARSSRRYPEKKVILYSGSFGEKDGVPYLLRGFKIVHDEDPRVYLVLTGKPPDDLTAERLACLARELGLDTALTFTGFVKRTELEALQQEASVLLVCRTKSDFARYGFPWKLAEYCLVGKPIVATDVGDIQKYFQDGISVFLAEPENADSIAGKVSFILAHPVEASSVAIAARCVALKCFEYRQQNAILSDFIRARLSSSHGK